jgi:hypothetical protein
MILPQVRSAADMGNLLVRRWPMRGNVQEHILEAGRLGAERGEQKPEQVLDALTPRSVGEPASRSYLSR